MKCLVAVFLLFLSASVLCDEVLVDVGTWDIIVAKPDGSVWSGMETNGAFYCVKDIEDEFTFSDDLNANIVYPYAVYSNRYPHGSITNLSSGIRDATSKATSARVLVKRSEYQIDPTVKTKKDKKLKKNSKDFGKNVKPK